jgi:hypothetical protein
MPHLSLRLAFALAIASTSALAACAAGSTNTFSTSTAGSGTGAGNTGTGNLGGTGGSDITVPDSGTGGEAPLNFLAYAHTGKTLYQFDPKNTSAAPVAVGDFDCYGADGPMMDLAVSKDGKIWGNTATKAYELTVQGTTVHCGSAITLDTGNGNVSFYALTFAPEGVIGTGETLIAGNTAGELWAIDTASGTLKQHGTFGKVPQTDGNGHDYPTKNQGKAWELSGDIVFLANNGKPVGFATVRDCPNPPDKVGCSTTDTLIQIDMTKLKSIGTASVTNAVRGQILESSSCSASGTTAADYEQLLGIAAWNDKVYGFSHNGAIVAIDNVDGSACRVVSSPSLYWNGAGVTTVAPVIVPPA